MKINLVSVIGHNSKIIPHWYKHYKDIVDDIYIIVYLTNNDTSIINTLGELGITPHRVVHSPKFHWEEVTRLYNETKMEKPDEWWVVADNDELHLYPTDLKSMIVECEQNGWEFITGGFIDRIGKDGYFSDITNQSIWQTFPLGGFFRYPLSGACPNKVCVMKGNIKVTSGQHYARIDEKTVWGVEGTKHPLRYPIDKGFIQVHHFKWDSSSIDRLHEVSNIKEDYTFWWEYEKMYKSVKDTKQIDITNTDFMLEKIFRNFNDYTKWKQLTTKIIQI